MALSPDDIEKWIKSQRVPVTQMPPPNKPKSKQDAYHGGREAAVRFESAMQKVLSVSKDRILELEKQKKEKRPKRSRNGLPR